jgi:hypothetical protein
MTDSSLAQLGATAMLLWFPYLFLVIWLADRSKKHRTFTWVWLAAYPIAFTILSLAL